MIHYNTWFLTGLFILCHLFQGNAEVGKKISMICKNGLVINQPGVYYFANDIQVNLENGKAAITIDANDVTLDLKEFTLSQSGTGSNNHGILVNSNHKSVSVKNGTIGFIHGFGIKVKKGNQIINLQNLVIRNSGKKGGDRLPDNRLHTGGILFLGTEKAPIKDVTLNQCQAINNRSPNSATILNGLAMAYVNNSVIENCSFSSNQGGSEVDVTGAAFYLTNNCTIKNSQADNNSNEPVNGSSAGCFGFHFNEISSDATYPQHVNVKVIGCSANHTIGKVIRAAGFRFRKVENTVMEDCVSYETINTLEEDPITADRTVTAAGGILFTFCNNFKVHNCNSYGHRVIFPSDRAVGGFDIARSNFGVLTDCHAAFCKNPGDGVFGGFVVEPALSQPDFARSTGIVFERCIAESNIGNTNGGGFTFLRAEAGKIIECEAIFNQPNGIEVGRQGLTLDDNTLSSIISDNLIISNSQVGIIDDNDSGLGIFINAYLSNTARNNSINFTLPNGTPIATWLLSQGGNLVAESKDNISIL